MFQIEVPKHPMHSVLREAGVPQVAAARYCGVSLSSLAHYLNSYRKMPEPVAAKLQELVAGLANTKES